METTFAEFDPWLVALLLATLMFLGWGVGWYIGNKVPFEPDEESAGRFVDGSLALLGLFLGFTFAMALSKHDQRRLTVIADSNSIADFYTTASFLPQPQRGEIQDAVRDYLHIRLSLSHGDLNRAKGDQAIADSEKLQKRITDLVGEAIASGTPVAVPLVNDLNTMTSSQASLIAAIRDRLPIEVLLLLGVAAVGSTVLVGRHHGARHRVRIAGTLCYVLLVVMAVGVILDLNRPATGMIRVSVELYERLAASIAK
jgi:VIT1/CCC1 family predicted Fe2+/Mn2+ transporter